jgi:ADP-heptose:LPS heptosyltransferase
MNSPEHFLLQFPSGMGNTVLALPAFNGLRQHYPDAKFHGIYRLKPSDEVLELNGGLSSLEYLPLSNPWQQMLRLRQLVKTHEIDCAISFFGNYDYRYNPVLRLSGVPTSIGFDHPRPWLFKPLLTEVMQYDERLHEADNNCRLLEPLGVMAVPTLYPPMERMTQADTVKRVAIHIGRHNAQKPGWPAARFKALNEQLRGDQSVIISLLGGHEEGELSAEFSDLLGPDDADLIGQLNVSGTVSVLQQQDLLVSNDTGPMHLAAMCGTPLVSIFGPTDQVKNSPRSQDPATSVIVSTSMACRPCYPNKVLLACEGRMECLQIEVERVYAACRAYL